MLFDLPRGANRPDGTVNPVLVVVTSAADVAHLDSGACLVFWVEEAAEKGEEATKKGDGDGEAEVSKYRGDGRKGRNRRLDKGGHCTGRHLYCRKKC